MLSVLNVGKHKDYFGQIWRKKNPLLPMNDDDLLASPPKRERDTQILYLKARIGQGTQRSSR